jgi:hypothetical protein
MSARVTPVASLWGSRYSPCPSECRFADGGRPLVTLLRLNRRSALRTASLNETVEDERLGNGVVVGLLPARQLPHRLPGRGLVGTSMFTLLIETPSEPCQTCRLHPPRRDETVDDGRNRLSGPQPPELVVTVLLVTPSRNPSRLESSWKDDGLVSSRPSATRPDPRPPWPAGTGRAAAPGAAVG